MKLFFIIAILGCLVAVAWSGVLHPSKIEQQDGESGGDTTGSTSDGGEVEQPKGKKSGMLIDYLNGTVLPNLVGGSFLRSGLKGMVGGYINGSGHPNMIGGSILGTGLKSLIGDYIKFNGSGNPNSLGASILGSLHTSLIGENFNGSGPTMIGSSIQTTSKPEGG